MNTKGQGALEYLLLIGGAVVVAAIVVVLLLGLGSTNQGQSDKTMAATLCAQTAALDTQVCIDRDSVTAGTQQRVVCSNRSIWMCNGTYPNCTVTDKNAVPTSC